jgi:hypothetical protein
MSTPDKYVLWIDGAGGFLVCLGNQVTFGQAVPEARVDIPLFADIAKRHATLSRDAEGYLLHAVRRVLVNGREVDRALLHSGDRVTLGASCQLLFRLPVSISATARLDLVSGQRLRQGVDAIFLMADTLVLGPGPQAHVIVPDLEQNVFIYRSKDGLAIHHPGPFTMAEKACRDRAVIQPNVPVAGERFSLALEALASA